MLEESEVVTAPADSTSDTIEVQSVNESQPENGSEKVTENTESTAPAEATPKPLNPRTQQRKAERERLIRENAAKDEQIKQLMAQISNQSAPSKPAEKALDLSKEPDIKDYTDAIQYARDLAKYDAYQMQSEKEKEAATATRNRQIETYQEQADAIRAEMPDFDAKVDAFYSAGLFQVGSPLEDAILSSSDSAKLVQHFVKFPGDLKNLNQYRPEAIPAALKQIQNWMKTQASANANPQPQLRQSQAKPPINPVGQKASTTISLKDLTREELENMPQHEFEAKYMRK